MGRPKSTYHGLVGSGSYNSWRAMKDRCYCKSHSAYAKYGGVGVIVVDRWLSFVNFYADMGPRPVGLTIDRIDRSKPYGPSNCRWATRRQQAINRACTKYSEEVASKVRFLAKTGYSRVEIRSITGINTDYIGDILNGRVWV